MSTIAAIAAVVTVGVLTYGSRAGLILFLADRPLPPSLQRALRYVGPAVLSALTVTLVAGSEGIRGVEAAEVVAIVVAGIVAATTRNLIASLVTGMAALWLVLLIF